MIELHSDIWRAFDSLKKRFGPFSSVDILTGYIGSGAHKMLRRLGATDGRIVIGLTRRKPALTGGQIDELKLLMEFIDLRCFTGLHAKLYILDRRIVVVGSANLTRAGFEKYEEVVIAVTDKRVLRSAQRSFALVWRASRTIPRLIRRLRPEYGDGGPAAMSIGVAHHSRRSPFSESIRSFGKSTRGIRDSGDRTIEDGRLDRRLVRIVAMNAWQVESERWGFDRPGREDGSIITWGAASNTARGDLCLFCVSQNHSGVPEFIDDPRFDSAVALFEAVSEAKDTGNPNHYQPQARFKRILKLDRPVKRKHLARARIVGNKGWPQSMRGRVLRTKTEVARLAKVLIASNRRQVYAIRSALGLATEKRLLQHR